MRGRYDGCIIKTVVGMPVLMEEDAGRTERKIGVIGLYEYS